MIHVDATDSSIDAKVKRFCAPIFANEHLLQGGHNESVTNATVTFVRFESKIYAVTCHHVLLAFLTEAVKRGRHVIPSIHSEMSVHQFGSYGAGGWLQWSFVSCRKFPTASEINNHESLSELDQLNKDSDDIAIADLTNEWPVLREVRNAEAINLDAWTEPDWSIAQPVWLAYGYPDDHKSRMGNQVAAPFPRVSAKLESLAPSIERPTYVLCSALTADHGWGFSGLSGGPMLIAHSHEDKYAFVGITFEGSPSSQCHQKNEGAFIRKNDILLRGYHLTPDQFEKWLMQRKYAVRLSPLST